MGLAAKKEPLSLALLLVLAALSGLCQSISVAESRSSEAHIRRSSPTSTSSSLTAKNVSKTSTDHKDDSSSMTDGPQLPRRPVPTKPQPPPAHWPTLSEILSEIHIKENLNPSSATKASTKRKRRKNGKVAMVQNDVPIKEANTGTGQRLKRRRRKKATTSHPPTASDEAVGSLAKLSTPSSKSSTSNRLASTVIDVAELGITDYGWNEDNIKFDFMTGKN